MLKFFFDFFASLLGLIILSPFLALACFFVFLQDFKSPFYIAPRVGKNEKIFYMVKLRSMIVNADKSGVDSTSTTDQRITKLGKFIRKTKLDELTQLWNVLKGDMSLVGPRPNVQRETDLYTPQEKKILEIKPGITDLASIVFADEGDILKDSADPDLKYNQVIRPYKSRLAIFYREKKNFFLDIEIILLTILGAVSRSKALEKIQNILKRYQADLTLIQIAGRQTELVPSPPPGANEIVTKR